MIDTSTAVPLIDLTRQHEALRADLIRAFEKTLDSGQFILGPENQKFEAALAEYCGTDYAVGVSSGTDALLVTMMAMGIGPGDEVITTPFTWFSTVSSITRLGAKPVFVDINKRTYNIDTTLVSAAITDKTKAIMPVHLYGQSADMDPLLQIARHHGVKLIEDAAQAIGATYDGKPVGSFGDAGCISFYPTKNLPGLGDAGAVVTNDAELADHVRLLHNHGMRKGDEFPEVGGNFRMDSLQAALLRVKLPHLDSWTQSRVDNAERYHRKLESMPLGLPLPASKRGHVYNQYTVRVQGGGRDALREHLGACGIGCRVYYPKPLHLMSCFKDLGYQHGDLPESERAAQEVLSLPVFPDLTKAQQDRVVEAVGECFSGD